MLTQTQALMVVVSAVALCLMLNWAMQFWQRTKDQIRRDEAKKVLRSRGMDVHLYLPSFGEVDENMRTILSAFDHTGYIILSSEGHLVGRVLPNTGQHRGLRLVVDNTK